MKKYLLGSIALVLAIGFSSFTHVTRSKKFTVYPFVYTGTQTPAERAKSINYVYKVTDPGCVDNTTTECGVNLTLTAAPALDSHPDFSGDKVTTDPDTGLPNGGSAFSSNETRISFVAFPYI
ncbi:MAG: hypothetical protein BGO55_31615 [Sphingobacteriales bacterium 50-39]|nr:hypothetical protein [Sphingobacteriales bacterium]OJW61050.1 MAG: hypothetical protein BGO55_31615 [Sphingobacteriales bacterium 50-39]